MWLLECDGDLFQGRKLWLMPGSRHVFGRTRTQVDSSESGVFHGISNKSVSRKHIIITVADAEKGDALDLGTRSALTIEDCSKIGTEMDGKKLVPSQRVTISRVEAKIKVGNWEHFLTIKWHPICLALAFISRKKLERDMEKTEKRIRHLDIKISYQYEVGVTTHVVSTKRNSAHTLKGLICGSYIVSESYIDALIAAGTPRSIESQHNPGIKSAALEDDFEKNLPDPLDFVPKPSKEPVLREPSYYRPDDARKTVFSKMSFFFCNAEQYDHLEPVIGLGGGKCFFYEDFKAGETSPAVFAEYVKQNLGEFGAMNVRKAKPFAVVSIPLDESNLEWKRNFIKQSDELLGQNSVLQNAFLDSILMNGTLELRKPLGRVNEKLGNDTTIDEVTRPTESFARLSENGPDQAKMEIKSPSKADVKRLLSSRKRTRFKGFDSFDTKDGNDIESNEVGHIDLAPQPLEEIPEIAAVEETRATRKRPLPDPMDSILPAATAMKKRKMERGVITAAKADAGSAKESVSAKTPKRLFQKTMVKRGKVDDINLENMAAAREQEEEERALLEETLRKNPLTEKECSDIRDQIGYDVIQVRTSNLNINQDETGNWEDQWNGRKNFKRFQKRGQGEETMRGHRRIVRLVEAVRGVTTLGAVRWTGASTVASTSRDSRADVDDDDDTSFRRSALSKSQTRSQRPETIELPDDQGYGHDVSTDLNSLPGGRAPPGEDEDDDDDDADLAATAPATVASIRGKGKRPATSTVAPAAKRATGMSARPRLSARDDAASSEDSEAELRFKSTRRAKR